MVNKINKTDHIIISGDLNARVGNVPIPRIVRTFGESTLNNNGQELRQFATFNNFKITNTFFRKKDIYKFTWSARGSRSLIDYIIVNGKLKNLIKDVRVYRGCDISSDHFMVCGKIALLAKWRKNGKTRTNNNSKGYKVHLLEDPSIKELYQRRLTEKLLSRPVSCDIEVEWAAIKQCIEEAAFEALGTKRKFRGKRRLRVWNSEIKEALQEKQRAYLHYLQTKSDESLENYRIKRNLAKSIVRQANQASWDKFISVLENDVHGRQQCAYKVLKFLNKDEKDNAFLNVIPGKDWIEHYKDLWCAQDLEIVCSENQRYNSGVDLLTIEELQGALKSTKNRKATGLDAINGELIKYGGAALERRFLHLLNECWKNCIIPDSWKVAEVISLFKKGKRSNCKNYRGISLLNVGYKIYSKIINNRMKVITEAIILEEQSGFRPGRSCTDNVFTIKRIIEKRREFNLETHIGFVDFEKAFDRVDRAKLWNILAERGYPLHLIEIIKSLYQRTRIVINTGMIRLKEFEINQGVRQGCGLSPTLFNIYLDYILRKWRCHVDPGIRISNDDYLNTLLFADDMLIIQENENRLQQAIHELSNVCKAFEFRQTKLR